MVEYLIAIMITAFGAALIDTALGMCYGTILTPTLLILGYPPQVVVPTVLFSQLVVDIVAGATHTKVKNFTRKDVKTALLVAIPATTFVALGAFSNLKLPKNITIVYIGLLVSFLGLLLIVGKKFKRSARGLVGISALAGFNKGFMGGGFGPVIVSGQIVVNHEVRPAVSIGAIAEIPVCLVGLLSFLLLGGISFMDIYLLVTIPAAIASIIGPLITVRLGNTWYAEKVVGFLTLILGLAVFFGVKA